MPAISTLDLRHLLETVLIITCTNVYFPLISATAPNGLTLGCSESLGRQKNTLHFLNSSTALFSFLFIFLHKVYHNAESIP
jgi:hypothetical protein